jgi:hypothetical protein
MSDTASSYAINGMLIGRTVTTTSADGLGKGRSTSMATGSLT